MPFPEATPVAAASEHDERALVAAARAGDRKAWEVVWRRYGPVIHGVLLARAGADAADDLTQEVFVKAMREIGSLRDEDHLVHWLVTIARNAAASRGRSGWRAGLRLVRLARETRAGNGNGAAGEVGEEARRVLGAIGGLPEAYQETLVLRLVEGLTGPQIAASLGMTHGSVRVNLCKGMEMLRTQLGVEKDGQSKA
ncbi:MAG: RNA polymerase sigma factor [Phycisphaerales bacterium]